MYTRRPLRSLKTPLTVSVYTVKEIYKTVQGEGWHTGRPAVFLRFTGCNLWTGREQDRSSAICQFCDTDFIGTDGPNGGKFRTATHLADAVRRVWALPLPDDAHRGAALAEFAVPTHSNAPYVVCTGGEPLLQLDPDLIDALHAAGFEIAVETNGTQTAPPGIDWICMSPKAGAPVVLTSGNELKLVYHQPLAPPSMFADLDFDHFFLQPMDGPDVDRFTADARAWCAAHPQWKMSIQTHKVLGIP